MAIIDALVLAGGPQDEIALLQPGAPNKCFIQIEGVTLAGRVIAALRGTASVGRIVVVAPPRMNDHPDLAPADELRADGVRITDSLHNGLAGFNPDRDVLIVASDLPVLTPCAVDDFVSRSRALGADVVYGCVEKRAHLERFPEVPHTWARMRDGTFCGGGMVTIKPRALPLLERFIERLGAARKHPFKLASFFGWDMLARFAVGRLTIAAAEARATRILGAPVRALVSQYPETGVNVDRVSDVELARRLVREGVG
ncbi:MAG TPA: nucleotidyltransferase family protein [Candidatus Cybelea sp.]|jgi:molybdopterin-guanine dinucleotide biosynthesis protein A|nr:nucleotidyltransferase family protein [Candidatus Cybelea sp.]